MLNMEKTVLYQNGEDLCWSKLTHDLCTLSMSNLFAPWCDVQPSYKKPNGCCIMRSEENKI